MDKRMRAPEAIALIKNNDTVAICGFVGCMHPELITSTLEAQFLATRTPRDLTIVFAAGQGDGRDKGMNHLGHEGLLKRAIGGHWALSPKIGKLALENKIEAYNFPQGVICHLYRDIAAKRPGCLTHIGLHTYVDPRLAGGKMNRVTTDPLVEVLPLHGQDYLFYKAFPLDIALVRASYCDENGNATFEREPASLEILAACQAVKNCGGKVLLQVEKVLPKEQLNYQLVKLPGIYVDAIVEADPAYHMQTYATPFDPSFCGGQRVASPAIPPLCMNERKIIARRCALELIPGEVINLGIGMPEGIANIAQEEGLAHSLVMTVESGHIGGIPASGLNFGAVVNADCVLDQPAQFDFYDGGGLDIAFLGMAQADRHGNVNVSKFGSKLAGCGGFIDISQAAKRLVFCGAFTAMHTAIRVENGGLTILNEGEQMKFLRDVEQITFSGAYALQKGQRVLYVTERAVFMLTKEGLTLTEIAPGIDLQRDILAQMQFTPVISENLRMMDARIFQPGAMGLSQAPS